MHPLLMLLLLILMLRGKLGEQKMADLPNDRKLEGQPFTNGGVDTFDPFWIKKGTKEIQRYGVLFTFLASRTVHFKCTCSRTKDSFIQALRRFIARRWNIRVLCRDNRFNFVGTQKELRTPSKKWIIRRFSISFKILVHITSFGTETHQHLVTWEVSGSGRFGQHGPFFCLS